MIVNKRRLLPIPGEVVVKVGDMVKASDIVAKTELPGRVHSINIANRLGVEPKEMRQFLLKKEGEKINANEPLAENKPFIPFFKTTVPSPVTGTIETVSDVTGQVLLREPPKVLNLLAYIDGKVIEVQDKFGVTVETEATFIQGIFGVGGEATGEIFIAVQAPDEELLPEHITDACKGKIVIGGNHAGLDAIRKAIKVGAAAVVAGGMHDKDLRELLGYDIGVAVTGTEKIGTTVVVTEGFSMIPMAKHTFHLLKSRNGEKASISGATQIRAGVMRPEIIIPGYPPDVKTAKKDDSVGSISIGDPIRIIREPHFGQIGKVTALPPELVKIATESHVRIMEVTLATGEKVTIPRSNIERLES
jgi:hypothetical protein